MRPTRRAAVTTLGLFALVPLVGLSLAAPAPAPAPPTRDLAKIKAAAKPHGTMFTYKSGTDDVSAYMAKPDDIGAHPAIIVIQEWWGLNDQIKGIADMLASKGYVAVAPDLYRGKVTTDPKIAMELLNALPDARAKQDLTSLFAYMKMNASVKALPIGSIGFCMGGGLSLMLATAEPQLAACAVCYGRPITDTALLQKIQAPILGTYGGADTGIPEKSVEAFKAQMTKLGKPVEVKIYPGAGHGFMNPMNPTFNAEATADAWTRIEAFFKQRMPPPKRPEVSGSAPPR